MTAARAPAAPLDVQSLSRACNELLILATLATGPHHGYQLALEIEERSGGAFRFRHGTLYPILHQLEKSGSIAGVWLDEESRRRRKSYQLTTAGRRALRDQAASWREFFDHLFHVVGEGET